MFEGLSKYLSIVLDYSVIMEYSNNTAAIDELIDLFGDKGIDCYVSDTFKLLHYCVVDQQASKDKNAQNSMRSLMQSLLRTERLHLVHTCNTEEFIEQVKDLSEACILTTTRGIFTKRLYEKSPVFNGDIAIVTNDGLQFYSSIQQMIDECPMPALSKLAKNDTFLDADARASINDVVTANNGEKFVLDKRLSGGAEGMVFTTNNPKLVAKIYHKGVITPLRWAKLKKLSELGITSPEFCIPQHLLFFQGAPVGYTMPLGKGTTLSNVFDGPDAMIEKYPYWTRLDICNTLLSLISKYLYLHMHDIIAGDIQLKNALIYSSTCQYMIDMDSVQIGNLPCPVGTEDFTDPRLWGRDFAGFVRKLKDEDYSIAMLVFSVLFCGLHPYATRNGAETLREEILNRNFPYTLDNSDTDHIPLGGYDHIWEYLPERLRIMLYNTFREGKSYEAVEWKAAVQEYKNELEKFAYDDPEAYKIFPRENYIQQSVNIQEGRAKYEQKKAIEAKRSEPKPVYEKKVFANAPSGRYVSSSVGGNAAFRPIRNVEDEGENKPEPAHSAGITPVNQTTPDPAKKNKKFFGLF